MRRLIHASLEGCQPSGQGFRALFRFANLEIFAGHFPGKPLLPGIFLIEAIRYAAERATGRQLAIRSVEEAKFTAEVKPDSAVTVEAVLTKGEGDWRCDASLSSVAGPVARVRLMLADEPAH